MSAVAFAALALAGFGAAPASAHGPQTAAGSSHVAMPARHAPAMASRGAPLAKFTSPPHLQHVDVSHPSIAVAAAAAPRHVSITGPLIRHPLDEYGGQHFRGHRHRRHSGFYGGYWRYAAPVFYAPSLYVPTFSGYGSGYTYSYAHNASLELSCRPLWHKYVRTRASKWSARYRRCMAGDLRPLASLK